MSKRPLSETLALLKETATRGHASPRLPPAPPPPPIIEEPAVEPPKPVVTAEPDKKERDGVLAAKLDTAARGSLNWCIEVLNMELPEQKKASFAAVVRAKGVAAQSALTLLARTDETRLKRQALGELPRLLKIIQDEEKVIIDVTPEISGPE